MKSLLHAMGNVFLTVLTILLVIYGWIFLEIKLLLKPQPSLFGYAFYQQVEDDMSPEFDTNDIVIVKKGSDYNEGDIVLYFDSKDSKYKVHYVVSKGPSEIVTKCSSCMENNEPVSTDNIVGKAVGKVLFMGAVVEFFKRKSVLITIGVVGVFFLVISQYLEFKPKKKEEKKEEAQK